jgi:hypothetical protein
LLRATSERLYLPTCFALYHSRRTLLMSGTPRKAPMLPTTASDLLTLDLHDAEAEAARGEVAAGWELLQAGLQRAQSGRYSNEPWREEFIHRYQEAMAEYARRHGFAVPPSMPHDNGKPDEL